MDDARTQVTPELRRVVEAYFDAVLRPDVRERLAAICQPNVAFHEVMGDFTGLAGFDSELLARPRALVPSLCVDLHELIGDATECAARWQLHGNLPAHDGGGTADAANTGTPLRTEGTTWFRFDGALIAEVWTYWDGATLFEAFGTAPDGI